MFQTVKGRLRAKRLFFIVYMQILDVPAFMAGLTFMFETGLCYGASNGPMRSHRGEEGLI